MPIEQNDKRKNRTAELLDKNLSAEYVSTRGGAGSVRYVYVEGWMMILLANKIFGYNGWSSEIKSMTEEYCENKNGVFNAGYSCICRITLKDGAYREDIGFGSGENMKTKGQAIEKAKKEAATDALKRALRQFGNALGNCCYDKEYIKKMQAQAGKRKKVDFDVNQMLRKSDFDKNYNISFSFDSENDISDS